MSAAVQDTGYDVVFLLDATVDRAAFDWMKSYVNDMAGAFDMTSGEYRVGAMTYGSDVISEFPLNGVASVQDVRRMVNGFR